MFNALSVCLDTGEINYNHHLELDDPDHRDGLFKNHEGVSISFDDAINSARLAVKHGATLIYSWYHNGDYNIHAMQGDDVIHLFDATFSHTNAYSG